MSQVDILTYSSVSFWSVVSFLILYFLVFSYLLPCVLTIFKLRLNIVNDLIAVLVKYYYYSCLVQHYYNNFSFSSLFFLLED